MKRCVMWTLAVVVLLVFSSVAPAGVPRLINYQGRLSDDRDAPVQGKHTLTFALYADDAEGVIALWSERHPDVQVSDGLFHVVLGSINPISDVLFSEDGLWIGVTVDSDSELRPRMQITSVPWAMRAAVADALADGTTAGRGAPDPRASMRERTPEPSNEVELEGFRTDLLSVTGVFSELGTILGNWEVQQAAADASDGIESMSLEDLAVFEEARSQIGLLRDSAQDLRDLMVARMSEAETNGGTRDPATPGFPDASYSGLCGSTRTNTEAFFAARIVLAVAQGVWTAASRACDEVIVAAGFGGNASLACIAADELLFAAQVVFDELANCDGDIDSAEVEGTYERVGHLHGDIDIINGKIDALLEAVEALRQVNCDIVRLLHTPQGQRESEIPVCSDQAEYPYDWGE